MNTKTLTFSTVVLFFLFPICFSCNSGTADKNLIPSDSAAIASGAASFNQYCSGCHNFRRDGIGPQLGGITSQVSPEWLLHFIRNPQQVITSGDKRAVELHKEWKVIMPSFSAALNDGQINAIIAFLHTHKSAPGIIAADSAGALSDPIPEKITPSNLTADLKFITQFPVTSDAGNQPLARITKLAAQPNSGALFINDLNGRLYKLKDGKPVVYLDMLKQKPRFINKPGLATGLGSFAFHPEFEKNGLLYTAHTEIPGSAKADFSYADSIGVTVQWVISEWNVNDPKADTFTGTSRELFRVDMVTGIHGVQEITFNPHARPGSEDYGLLYIGVGDGGCVEYGFPFLVHSKEKIWGAVIRINPGGNNSANGKYGIPPQNPFVQSKNANTVREIYAYGFRNPHRITWSKSGKMLVSNIGQRNSEALYMVMSGDDCGWPDREGSFVLRASGDIAKVFPLPANDSINHYIYPVAEFDHDEGLAMTGGYEYEGTSVPQLKGKFLFGDMSSGRLFYADVNDIKRGKKATIREWSVTVNGEAKTLKQICNCDRADHRFGRDAKGELYVLTKADGKLYRLEN
jgi:glucose/arabinose dehydrogenase/cytochrome c2